MTLSPALDAPVSVDVEALVASHLPLARHAVSAVVTRLHLPVHLSRDDLIASANVALFEAARRYDPTVGASFATYARPRLQGAVLDTLRASDWATRSVRSEARRLEAAVDALTFEHGTPPTTEQVADRLGVTVDDVDALRHDVVRASVRSIDEGGAVEAALPVSAETPEWAFLKRERIGYLMTAVEALPDRLGEVIERNFFNEEALTSIAESMQVTLSRVSQMRAQGLRLLHAAMSEIVDGRPVAEAGGSRARAQQRRYVEQVAAVSDASRGGRGTRTQLVHGPQKKVLAFD